MVGREDVGALGVVEEREEVRPAVRKDPLRAAAERPEDLRAPGEKDAAEDQPRAALRVGLRVGEAEGRAPGAAEDEPFLEAEPLPDPLRVGDEVPGRVLAELAERGRLSGAALVEEDHAPGRRVEEAAVKRRETRAGTTVEEDDGLPGRVPRLLDVDLVEVGDAEPEGVERLEGGEEVGHGEGLYGVRNVSLRGREVRLPNEVLLS